MDPGFEWLPKTEIMGIPAYLLPIVIYLALVVLIIVGHKFRRSWVMWWIPEEIPANLVVIVGVVLLATTLIGWTIGGYWGNLTGILTLATAVLLGVFTWPKWWTALLRMASRDRTIE